MSDPEARHSRNIAARQQVAIVIFDAHEAGGWKAVYVSATAGEVTGADVERGSSSSIGDPWTGACASGRRRTFERVSKPSRKNSKQYQSRT